MHQAKTCKLRMGCTDDDDDDDEDEFYYLAGSNPGTSPPKHALLFCPLVGKFEEKRRKQHEVLGLKRGPKREHFSLAL